MSGNDRKERERRSGWRRFIAKWQGGEKKSPLSSINTLPTQSEKRLTKLLPRTSLKTKALKEYLVLLYQVETKYQVGSQQ